MNTLSIGDAFRFGRDAFKKRPWFFIGIALIILVINWLTGKLATAISAQPGTQILGTLVNLIVASLIGMGMTHLFLKAEQSVESATWEDLWYPHLFLKYLVTIILYGIVVFIGAIPIVIAIVLGVGALLSAGFSVSTGHASAGLGILALLFGIAGIVLSLYASSVFMFAPYNVVDRELGPIEAMRESKRMTRGHRGTIIGLILMAGLINIVGLICLVIGILVTLPVSLLAIVRFYRTLSGNSSTGAAPVSQA